MAISKNTPGVWVEEVSTFPPSVAQVATAIPAFIGYTETGSGVARISSLLDYESLFGKAKPSKFKAASNGSGGISLTRTDAAGNNFLMHYGLSLYFRNGGGPCYIISIGNYGDSKPDKEDFTKGLELLKTEDEPTLVVLLDAVNLDTTDYYDLVQQALGLSQELGDRFVIIDVPSAETDFANFRQHVGVKPESVSYGAAYYPYLQTTLNYQYREEDIEVPGAGTGVLQWVSGDKGIKVTYTGEGSPKVKVISNKDATAIDFDTTTDTGTLAITTPTKKPKGSEVATAWTAWSGDKGKFDVTANGDGSATLSPTDAVELTASGPASQTLAGIKTTNTSLYNQVRSALGNARVVLPPSPAVAGIYVKTDSERGVWKAPANVGIASVIGPVSKISNEEQGRLNVDEDSGKSINAIRDFTGKGSLVWGARTLAGNDNEWRYVPVRRLFITIEESTRKASSFAVFEPNDATTWLKVKAMIESYLYGLWEQGALAGSKPESAYFVNVGLGKTMTAQNILDGYMIVEIGVAAVRPAEFIILKFSHKMQEA